MRLAALIAAAVLSGIAGSSSTAVGRQPRATMAAPDIVVVLIEDFGDMDLRLWRRLPAIRTAFLEQGTRFTDYVGSTPRSSPGRASVLIGRWAHCHGVTANDPTSFDDSVTIATELRAAGYHTFIAGKYLNHAARLVSKTPSGWDHSLITGGRYYDYTAWLDGVPSYRGSAPEDYSTDVVADRAVRWIRRAPPDWPLFALLAPYAAHNGVPGFKSNVLELEPIPAPRHVGDLRCADIPPWTPPHYNEADVSDKPVYIRDLPLTEPLDGLRLRTWCETMLSVDDLFARVQRAMVRQGRGDTLYVLMSANGMAWGGHRVPGKLVPYATPIPLFVHWPARLGIKRRVVRTTVTDVDWAPTLCAIAGCTMGPFPDGSGTDGRSIRKVILGRDMTLDRSFIYEEQLGTDPGWYGVRTTTHSDLGRWVFTAWETGERELYDLSANPWQLENLAGREVYQDLERTLAEAARVRRER